MIIKCLTLIQPWATLIGEKEIETRSRNFNYRGNLGIHAGKKIDYAACEISEIKLELRRLGYYKPEMLPTSKVISVCYLFDCVKMEIGLDGRVTVRGYEVSDMERAFGDYAPIPARGNQGLWNFDYNKSKFEGQVWA